MRRFKCRITKDKELLVERIPGKSYYYKFTFKNLGDIVMNHKRSVIIYGETKTNEAEKGKKIADKIKIVHCLLCLFILFVLSFLSILSPCRKAISSHALP